MMIHNAFLFFCCCVCPLLPMVVGIIIVILDKIKNKKENE